MINIVKPLVLTTTSVGVGLAFNVAAQRVIGKISPTFGMIGEDWNRKEKVIAVVKVVVITIAVGVAGAILASAVSSAVEKTIWPTEENLLS